MTLLENIKIFFNMSRWPKPEREGDSAVKFRCIPNVYGNTFIPTSEFFICEGVDKGVYHQAVMETFSQVITGDLVCFEKKDKPTISKVVKIEHTYPKVCVIVKILGKECELYPNGFNTVRLDDVPN